MTPQSILLLAGPHGWAGRVLARQDRYDAVRCASPEEVRVELTGSRPWAGVLIDGGHPGSDRDLIAAAARSGARPLVVAPSDTRVDWIGLGAAAVLPPDFSDQELERALTARTVTAEDVPQTGQVITVMGPGGTGSSTLAMALSQGLAGGGRQSVLLADFSRYAEQHVLHHLEADGPGIGDIVEAHRSATPDTAALRSLATPIPARHYAVLGGIRRAVGWSSIRPRALEASLRSLRGAYGTVVCDTDADLEGEAEGGSVDVEERNALARSAVAVASVVVVVGGPGLKGAHALLRVLGELWAHGVDPGRTLAAINRGDEISVEHLDAALERLGARTGDCLYLPAVELEAAHIGTGPLPEALVRPLTAAVDRLAAAGEPAQELPPAPIRPGSLGVRATPEG